MKRLLISAILLLLLAACSTNRVNPPIVYHSSPVFGSTYLFSLATVQLYQEDFESADLLFRGALQRDPLSFEIRKQILRTNLYRFERGSLTVEAMNGLIDSLYTEISFDEDMLNYAYSFYYKSKNNNRLPGVIEELIAKYPSAKAYLYKVFYTYTYEGKIDKKALNKAAKLAHNDPENLYIVAGLYSATDPDKAISTLLKLRKLQMNPTAETMLLDTFIKQNRLAEVKDLFFTYNYPEDLECMSNYLSVLKDTPDLGLNSRVADRIIQTGNRELITDLLTSAFAGNFQEIISKIESQMIELPPNPEDDSKIYAVLMANQLCTPDVSTSTNYAEKLCSITDADAVVAYCMVHFSRAKKVDYTQIDSTFIDFMKPNLQRLQMPEQLSSYIKTNVGYIFEKISPESLFVSRRNCANYFIKKGFAGVADYSDAIREIYQSGDQDSKEALIIEAISHFPHEASFLNDLGYTYLTTNKNLDEAKALIRRALDIEPQNSYYLDSMAWYYYLTDQPQKAVQYIYYPSIMKDIPGEISFHIGMIFYKLGSYEDAIKYLQMTIDKGDSSEYPAKAAETIEQIRLIQASR